MPKRPERKAAAPVALKPLPASYKYTLVEIVNEHVLVVTLNRPTAMNALNYEADAELEAIWDHYETNPALWVAILRAVGPAFCAGFDLKFALQVDHKSRPAPTGFGGLTLRSTCFKPIIAAVHGFAFGGGFEFALACDIVLAAEKAEFALPEPKRGLAALAGGLVRLPRLIGYQRAMDLILTGRKVSAAEGFRLGFVTEVVANDKLYDRALEYAQMISECSPDSLRCSKAVAMDALKQPNIFEAMENQYNVDEVWTMLSGENRVEGLKAFAEKRKPKWISKM